MPGRVLIIDDDVGFAEGLARSLRQSGHDVVIASTAAEGKIQLASSGADVVVLDYQLPDANGLNLLTELQPVAGGAVIIMATAFPDVDVAVNAMRSGAFDYLAKGTDPRECLMRIERSAEVALLRRRVVEATHTSGETTVEQGLLGESRSMRALRSRLEALASSDDTTALIMGETGTGKGVVARAIHAKSGRAYEPFVAVDCTTIPSTLVESELFGYEKGAFSGAAALKLGRVEAAGRGTLFLDEIGELDLITQAKLLRLLEEREFSRVGSTRPRRLQARIITATNRDLPRAVEEGRFRADLRYRLEVFVVEVPPLRERGEDVQLLASHFAAERARALGRRELVFHAEVVTAMRSYPFPGNVRELRNMVEQAVLLARSDELTVEEFPVLKKVATGWMPPPSQAIVGTKAVSRSVIPADGQRRALSQFPAAISTLKRNETERAATTAVDFSAPPPTLDDIRRRHAETEREMLLRALQNTGGNVSAAAKKIGISRYQLLRRLAKYGVR